MNTNVNKDKEDWIRNFSRFGMAAKGVVYILIGILTSLAAFGSGGEGKTSGKEGAFSYVLSQPFGKVLLGIIAFSLVGYVVWRAVQAIKDPEDEGTKSRLGYATSGIFYAFISFTAFSMVFSGSGGNGSGSGGNGGGSGSQEQMVSEILSQSWGQWVVGIIALAFFGKAIWQFYRAYSGKFKNKLQDQHVDKKVEKLITTFGKVGYTARGIVISIIGVLFIRAAMQSDASEAGGTQEAFNLIQQESAYGTIILGIVALGLVAYGVFMFVKAKYRIMPSL